MYLVTGSSGFLGSEFIKSISKDKYKTLGRNKRSDFIIDLNSSRIDNNNFNSDKFNAIVHIAGLAHIIPKSKEENDEMYNVNYKGTKKLLNLFEGSKNLKKIIFISSVAVYGLQSGININENCNTNPISSYGKSKLNAEKYIIDWAKKRNISYYILRLPLIVGYNPPGNLGNMINSIKKNRFFLVDNGNAKKSMVLENDVAKLIINIKGQSGIYNLTDGHHPSFNEITNIITDKFKKRNSISLPYFIVKFASIIGTVLFGRKFPLTSDVLAKMTNDLTFDDSRARKYINWKSKKVIENLYYYI